MRKDPCRPKLGILCQTQHLPSIPGTGTVKGQVENWSSMLTLQVLISKNKGCNRPSALPAFCRMQKVSFRLVTWGASICSRNLKAVTLMYSDNLPVGTDRMKFSITSFSVYIVFRAGHKKWNFFFTPEFKLGLINLFIKRLENLKWLDLIEIAV